MIILAKFIINTYLCNMNLILQLERRRQNVAMHLQGYMMSKPRGTQSLLLSIVCMKS